MPSKDFNPKDACKITGLKIERTRSYPLKKFCIKKRTECETIKKSKILQNKASLLLHCCLLMCPGGVKAGLSLMSLEVLSVMHIIDVIWSTYSAAIALHVFLWIMRLSRIFPRLNDPERNLYCNYQKPLRVWRHNENSLFSARAFPYVHPERTRDIS